jgi:hypothetical protein
MSKGDASKDKMSQPKNKKMAKKKSTKSEDKM